MRPEAFTPRYLTRPDELAPLAQEWDRVARDSPSPFLGSAWSRAWWQTAPWPVRCLVLCDEGGRFRAGVLISRRTFGVRGAADVHSGDWGVVAADPVSRVVLWQHIAVSPRPVPRLVLPALDERSAGSARSALEVLGYRVVEVGRLDSPVLMLPPTFEELLSRVSKGFRKKVRTSREGLERRGSVVLRTSSGLRGLSKDLDTFLRLEASGWKGSAGTAILCHPRTAALYRSFASLAAEGGSLRLQLLEVDGVAVAAAMSSRISGRVALIKSAYDEDLAELSPGLVLRAGALRAAIAEGAQEYDFLGSPDEHKLRWRPEIRPRRTLLALRGPWALEAPLRKHVRPRLGRLRRAWNDGRPVPPTHALPRAR